MSALTRILLLLTLLFSLPASAADTVKIGLNYPASGRYKEQGLAQIRAALLAVEEINASGGVLGRPLELLRANTASRPERAVANVETLTRQGAVMLFGGASSTATMAAARAAEQHDRLYFATMGYDNTITGLEGRRNLFREPYSSFMAAKALAAYMNENLQGKKFFYLTSGYSEGWSMESALRTFTHTQSVFSHPAARTPYPNPAHRDFEYALRQARDSGAEVLVLIQLGEDMVLALNEVYRLGLKEQITIIVPNLTLGMAQAAGAGMMEDVIGAVPWSWKVPYHYGYLRGQQFVEAFRHTYQLHPSSAAASAYSVIYQFRDAAERAGSLDTAQLVAALENHNYRLLKDNQSWRGFDHQNQQTVYVVRSRSRDQIMHSELREDFFDVLLRVPAAATELTRSEWEMIRAINDRPLALE
ncbi:MAG: ABC transporter substrate-binding protein [Pseudomonadota bacterium]|nr:ABC transporter substrate-binding protein [Pseudomonadota bacterium]